MKPATFFSHAFETMTHLYFLKIWAATGKTHFYKTNWLREDQIQLVSKVFVLKNFQESLNEMHSI